MNQYRKQIGFGVLVLVLVAGFFIIKNIRVNNTIKGLFMDPIDGGFYSEIQKFKGERYLVPVQDIVDSGIQAEDVPALVNPTFDSVDVADEYLDDSVYGIDVEVKGEHRFYSFQIMNWHQVVMDEFLGENLVITHGPFCRSSHVFSTDESFSAAAKNYNTNILIQDDETGSLWSQLTGISIQGDRTGEELETYPHTILKWGDWKEIYPDGMALSNETGHTRDYTRHPYLDYDVNKQLYFPQNYDVSDLTLKWLVHGVSTEEGQIAFSKDIERGFKATNTSIGDRPIVALYEEITGIIRVFDRLDDDGNVLTFTYDFDEKEIRDDETNSLWNEHGKALQGELAGTQLNQIESPESFWMCWNAHYPDTEIGNVDRNQDEE